MGKSLEQSENQNDITSKDNKQAFDVIWYLQQYGADQAKGYLDALNTVMADLMNICYEGPGLSFYKGKHIVWRGMREYIDHNYPLLNVSNSINKLDEPNNNVPSDSKIDQNKLG